MIIDVKNVIELTNDMSSKDRIYFEAKIVGRYTLTLPATLRDKLAIHGYTWVSHCFNLYRKIPLKR